MPHHAFSHPLSLHDIQSLPPHDSTTFAPRFSCIFPPSLVSLLVGRDRKRHASTMTSVGPQQWTLIAGPGSALQQSHVRYGSFASVYILHNGLNYVFISLKENKRACWVWQTLLSNVFHNRMAPSCSFGAVNVFRQCLEAKKYLLNRWFYLCLLMLAVLA